VGGVWFGLRRAIADNVACGVVVDPALELYFAENSTLQFVISGRNSRERWVNPLREFSESE
jgi:hypothetical protein